MPEITAQLVEEHNLTAEEYERILRILGREPSIAELGIFSVMWSEHCSYKSSRPHLKRFPTSGAAVVQGPGENAGIVDIGHGWVCAFKIESHNHPSFVEPLQGAATGVGGILRDIFTMGARPIAVMDSLRFGPVTERADFPGINAALNRRILRGVVSGIAFYGNCFGVPTVGGEVVFEPCYQNNPLVNVFALGIARKNEIFYARASGPDNPVIYVGAKTGKDGIHGASLLASAEFSGADGQQKRPNVQVGDPFLEKLLLEACLEAMHTGAILGIQDMGAAGLTCSTCEMGDRGGVGIEIELNRVPQRETGMTPYEIMLSESQERMLLVAQRGREQEVMEVFRKWGLDAVEIGAVIEAPVLRVKQHGAVVAEIPNRALTEEAPVYDRPRALPRRLAPLEPPLSWGPRTGAELAEDLRKLLGTPTLASKRWIFEQYDSMVRTNTVIGPGGDAALLRIKETGQGLAMSLDGNGRHCFLDPRRGARLAVAESARNVSVTGAQPLAATNCLNFGNPEKPMVMWQFREVVEGIAEACEALSIPITGGNVSFYNETEGQAIYPTPVLGVVGLLESVERHCTAPFQNEGRSILLLGNARTPGHEFRITFGSSQYAQTVLGALWGLPPEIDLDLEQRVQACCRRLIAEALVESAHDISDGGLAVALAECCMGKSVGAAVDLPSGSDPLALLFSEDPSRILVSVPGNLLADAKRIAGEYNVTAETIGTTGGKSLRVTKGGKTLFDIPLSSLRLPYEAGLELAVEKAGVGCEVSGART
ncbi:MAG: phosphoribosylformylglycinamidine synthase II [Acidobacteria bacterium RIFCSPLOWO2_12_FULL_60_22]|nr:MAG: phosphoribosylformylglycinamidine synthase II [Acidobacteria bacterium RIFCSPLOWO2_12_FULL_60_22]